VGGPTEARQFPENQASPAAEPTDERVFGPKRRAVTAGQRVYRRPTRVGGDMSNCAPGVRRLAHGCEVSKVPALMMGTSTLPAIRRHRAQTSRGLLVRVTPIIVW
jgi:hypothetical protein